MTNTDVVLAPTQWFTHVEIINAVKMKLGKAVGPSEVNTGAIVASGKIGVEVMVKLCQRVLDGKRIPHKCMTNVVVPIY